MEYFIKAAMWINVSAGIGNTSTGMLQSNIESEMSSDQISESREMAGDCCAKSFKFC